MSPSHKLAGKTVALHERGKDRIVIKFTDHWELCITAEQEYVGEGEHVPRLEVTLYSRQEEKL